MNCNDCANKQENYGCRTMSAKPRGKWCYRTKEQAIEAEKAIIVYAESHPAKTEKEFKQNMQAQKWAQIHIDRLMQKEDANV